ncbi:Uma2 family endonuclease [Streptomyces scopuliridis]|uniref:Uma2 family endonuclease n=1 Tax=Streptomyces scopuliridis TaxID=452529 RepID=UPI002DD84622|nr:Uma2 family endonuclease [Streptomyces scopuliridis]WSB35172.1 Uma2 family endonuclease [Streptomyces scopuliridis]
MTPRTVRRAQMSIEDFEQVARTAPETVKFEFINGRIEVKPMPDQLHKAMVMWFLRQCMQHRPELALYPEQGLVTETYRNGRARPDGALAPLDHFVGHGEWVSADGVLMAVEVTSHDRDTDLRDRVEKRDGYAATGIPVYLLVDRDAEKLVVYTDPYKGEYQNRASHAYGATVKLPHPVSITLETEKLKDYTR